MEKQINGCIFALNMFTAPHPKVFPYKSPFFSQRRTYKPLTDVYCVNNLDVQKLTISLVSQHSPASLKRVFSSKSAEMN